MQWGGYWRLLCFCDSKQLFKMIHYSKDKWVMMLTKCKKDSFSALCGPAEVIGCQNGRNPSVSGGRPKWAGMLAEDSKQDVLLCVRHWSEHYTACWHCLNNSSSGWGSHESCARVQCASSTMPSASSWGCCFRHAVKAKVRVSLATQSVPFSVKMGGFWHSSVLQPVLTFCSC